MSTSYSTDVESDMPLQPSPIYPICNTQLYDTPLPLCKNRHSANDSRSFDNFWASNII